MRRRAFLCAIVLGTALAAPRDTACSGPDGAGDPLAEAVDLERLRARTLQENPDIRAAEQRWQGARTRPSQEGSLPDPMVNTAYHNEGFDRLRQGASDFSFLRFGVEQEVPFPGKLSLKSSIAASEADRERALYCATVLDVLTRLRIAYDDYVLATKSLEIVEKNRALLEKLERGAAARYQVGEGVQADVARAQVELSILLGRLTGLEQARQSATAMLNAILNRPAGSAIGRPAPIERKPLAHSLAALEQLARDRSPDLQAAEVGIVRAESNLDLARRQYYPDFVLRADYFNKARLVPEWEIGAGIRIPLYFWRKQKPGVDQAAAGVSEARATRQSTLQDVLAKLRDFYAQATAADRLVTLYQSAVVPQADVALNSASAGYQVGKVDFLTMLNSFTVLNEYELRYHEELTNFDKAVARLDEIAGLAIAQAPGDDLP